MSGSVTIGYIDSFGQVISCCVYSGSVHIADLLLQCHLQDLRSVASEVGKGDRYVLSVGSNDGLYHTPPAINKNESEWVQTFGPRSDLLFLYKTDEWFVGRYSVSVSLKPMTRSVVEGLL